MGTPPVHCTVSCWCAIEEHIERLLCAMRFLSILRGCNTSIVVLIFACRISSCTTFTSLPIAASNEL
jgi:hypothetical protein